MMTFLTGFLAGIGFTLFIIVVFRSNEGTVRSRYKIPDPPK